MVRPERLDAAAQAMARVAGQWDRRLQAIKRIAEATYDDEQRKPRATEEA